MGLDLAAAAPAALRGMGAQVDAPRCSLSRRRGSRGQDRSREAGGRHEIDTPGNVRGAPPWRRSGRRSHRASPKMVRTFDMEALATTGFTVAEGSGGSPTSARPSRSPRAAATAPAFPPTLGMNDCIAGYLGGAGVATRRLAPESRGGRQLPRARQPGPRRDVVREPRHLPVHRLRAGRENRMIELATIKFSSPYGEATGSRRLCGSRRRRGSGRNRS